MGGVRPGEVAADRPQPGRSGRSGRVAAAWHAAFGSSSMRCGLPVSRSAACSRPPSASPAGPTRRRSAPKCGGTCGTARGRTSCPPFGASCFGPSARPVAAGFGCPQSHRICYRRWARRWPAAGPGYSTSPSTARTRCCGRPATPDSVLVQNLLVGMHHLLDEASYHASAADSPIPYSEVPTVRVRVARLARELSRTRWADEPAVRGWCEAADSDALPWVRAEM